MRRTQRNARRNRRSLVVPTNASTSRIPRCSRPLRARPTIVAGHCTWLPSYPRVACLRVTIRERCPQGSHIRRVQRNRMSPSRHRSATPSGPPHHGRQPDDISGSSPPGRTDPGAGDVVHAPARDGGVGGQRNAQRNLASVASTSNASTRDVAFGLVAPSGKTYIRAGPGRCQPRLSTSFEVRRAIPRTLSTGFPHQPRTPQ
jgi:hypothetical protein